MSERTLPLLHQHDSRSKLISLLLHVMVVTALISSGRGIITGTSLPRVSIPIFVPRDVLRPPTDLHPDQTGGGGGGDRSDTPASLGRLPRFAIEQLAPPEAVVRAENPKLVVEPTLLGPPDIKLPSPDLRVWGDPHGVAGPPSNGPGDGGGIGSKHGRGIGDGDGDGFDVGSRSGFSNLRGSIVSGASAPVLIYRVEPEFTDAARQARHQGAVLINVIVDADGRVRDPRLASSSALGFGLDERALEAVKQWKFKPGMKDGRAVAVYAQIVVTFRLL